MRTSTFGRPALALAALLFTTSFAPAQSATGQWQNGPNLPYFPVHMSLMPNGTVVMWPGDGGVSGNDPRQLDPVTGVVTSLTAPGYDIFCAGQSWLPDNRLFVAGGHISNNVGLSAAVIYDPVQNTWTRQPSMNAGRWYPSEQVMPNGDVLVVSGDTDLTVGENLLPQVWQASTGTWRSLTNAQLELGLYPTLSLAPNGKVFDSGPSVTTRYLDTTGTGAWTTVGNHIFNSYRDYDSMVMYQPGKILVAGGSDPATNTAEVIDLNQPSPAWRSTANMAYARRQLNALMLPDGKVLVTGGTGGPGFSNPDPTLAAYAAEEWDPATEHWTTLASQNVPRLYHSISMLMPDGRVLSTGGNSYMQSEFFSPPYLFAGPRPTITSAPASALNGQSITVSTPDAANITQVSWVRLPSTTHTYSMSQAFYSSTSITRGTSSITITSPNDPTLPPGYYMLFILKSGVPSVASIVRLGSAPANNPVPVVTSITPASTVAGNPPMTLTVNGSNFTNGSTVWWNGNSRPTSFVSGNQLTAVIPAADTLAASTAQVSVFNGTPGGGTSNAQAFTVNAQTGPLNLTQYGSIIAKVMAPAGMGNHNPEVIRDGDMPAPNTVDTKRQYDTYNNLNTPASDWIGYQYGSTQSFTSMVFQEGMHFSDGGYFNSFTVQVRQAGVWTNVPGIAVSPTYPNGNDGVNYQTYNLSFPTISGDAIRLYGVPGGTSAFISVGELQVYGPSASNGVPAVTTVSLANVSPSNPATLTVNGSGFVGGSIVQWNGNTLPTTFVSSSQLTAAVPAASVQNGGDAQITVTSPAPGGGVSNMRMVAIPLQNGSPNLTQIGTIIARITAPNGGGNKNLEIIRDGDKPAIGTYDSSRQYDTFVAPGTYPEDWIGYQYTSPQVFGQVLFQEGMHFGDGGWFNSLNVQVRQNGTWVSVPNLVISPVYPNGNDGSNFKSYTLQFGSITGDAIRIDGVPGGSAGFISVAELEVYGPATLPNLAQSGSVIAKVMAPNGMGNHDLNVIRDGIKPAPGSSSLATEYDSYFSPNTSAEDWIGYQYTSPQSFGRVLFQEGMHFGDGGWFNTLTVQVRQNGVWNNVSNLVITPAYPNGNDGVNFTSYTLQFDSISGDAIRIDGAPGGSSGFVSVGELEVYAK